MHSEKVDKEGFGGTELVQGKVKVTVSLYFKGLYDKSIQSIIGATLKRRDGSERAGLVFTGASGFSKFISTDLLYSSFYPFFFVFRSRLLQCSNRLQQCSNWKWARSHHASARTTRRPTRRRYGSIGTGRQFIRKAKPSTVSRSPKPGSSVGKRSWPKLVP